MYKLIVSGSLNVGGGHLVAGDDEFESQLLFPARESPECHMLDVSGDHLVDREFSADWICRADLVVTARQYLNSFRIRLDHSMHIMRDGFLAPGDPVRASERSRKVETFDIAIAPERNEIRLKSMVGTRHRAPAMSLANIHVELVNGAPIVDRRPRQRHRLILGGAVQILDHDYAGDSEFGSAIVTSEFDIDDSGLVARRLLDETVDDEVGLTVFGRAERKRNEFVAFSLDASLYEGNRGQRRLRDLHHARMVLSPSTSTRIPLVLRNQLDGNDRASGMFHVLLIRENPAPVQSIALTLGVAAHLVDDERRTNEEERFFDEVTLALSDFSAREFFSRDYRAGGELRVEIRALAQLLPRGRVAIYGIVSLFEGRTEGSTDLDGVRTFGFTIDPATFSREVIRVSNTDEGGDFATITIARGGDR